MAKTPYFCCRRPQVVRKLKSHMPWGVAKKLNKEWGSGTFHGEAWEARPAPLDSKDKRG